MSDWSDVGTDQSVHPETQSTVLKFGAWEWRKPARGAHYRTCSYCGSISPIDLANEERWHADWADRKYGWPHKFYVDITSREPQRLHVLGSTNAVNKPPGDWVTMDDLTKEQRAAADDAGYGFKFDLTPNYLLFGHRLKHHAKFYSVHLRDSAVPAETKKMIELRSGITFEFDDTSRIGWRYL